LVSKSNSNHENDDERGLRSQKSIKKRKENEKEKEWPAKKGSEREESVHTRKDNMEI
jgi:hypothetical protein